jgi:uncharacterized protein (TIRG00374 family)
MTERSQSTARKALFLAGVAILAAVFWAVGWRSVAANLRAIGGWFLALAALYALAQLAFARGWWCLIGGGPRRISFRRLFAVYLAGDSINAIGPANVAGEPVKAQMLRDDLGGAAAVASLTIHKHADILAQSVFLAAGVAAAWVSFPLPLAVRIAAAASVAGLAGFVLLMTWALRKGSYSPILRWLCRWRFLAVRIQKLLAPAEALDARIQGYYGSGARRFWEAAAWCLLGWCGGALETYIVVRLLAPGRGWPTAIAIEALAMALNNMLLFVPGRLGTAEGVRVGAFLLVGLSAPQGAAYALVRRARELVWALPGLVVLLRTHTARLGRRGIPEIAPAASRELSR